MGSFMDTFMDKIAQKFNAQEIIKANSAAEERELQQLRSQIAEYDTRLQEIRKLNLMNLEIADKLEAMIEANQAKQDAENSAGVEQVEQLKQIVAATEDMKNALTVNQADNAANLDAIHKECVKVYRNVQAVVEQGLLAQTQSLSEQNVRVEKKVTGLKPIAIIGLVLTIANLAVLVCNILGII